MTTAASNPTGLVAVTRRIAELLEREDLSDSTRQAIRTRLHQRDFLSIEQLSYELDRITSTLNIPLDRAG